MHRPTNTPLRLSIAVALLLAGVAAGAQPSGDAAPAAVDDNQIARLVEQLGADAFFAREQAQAELAKLGYEAFDALIAAQDHEDIEIASRSKYLTRLIKIEWTREEDPPPLRQLLDNYDQLDQPTRAERLRHLALQTDAPWVAAICRIVRFDRFPLLSKQAAMRLIEQHAVPADAWPQRGEVIVEQLGRSPRPGAEWLRLYVQTQTDPEAALAQWAAAIASEERVLAQYPEESDAAILASLERYRIALLERLGRDDEIDDAIARLIAAEPGDNESLIRLIDWLVERKKWKGLDLVQQRFPGHFKQEPMLAYRLAGARRVQGDSEAADALAAQAQRVNPASSQQHMQLAMWLRERGWNDWTETEFRRLIEIGPPESNDTLTAQFRLADMLHDRMADDAAGDVLEQAIASLDKALPAGRRQEQFKQAFEQAKRFIAARMHYYRACQYQRQNDRAKQAEHLAAGAEQDPTDADILIGLYRLPDQTDEEKTRTERLIAEAAAKFRAQIAQSPGEANGYNQLAWLLSNTDRDQQEALEASLESLKLKPNEPGYLDTLGHCFYALKDYANAVKYQQQAVDGEPGSGQMKRQLELFQQALAESTKQP